MSVADVASHQRRRTYHDWPDAAVSGTRAITNSSALISTEPSTSPKRTLGREFVRTRLFPTIAPRSGSAKLAHRFDVRLPLTSFCH